MRNGTICACACIQFAAIDCDVLKHRGQHPLLTEVRERIACRIGRCLQSLHIEDIMTPSDGG